MGVLYLDRPTERENKMSEFVLKLAGWESESPIVWLPGVIKVSRFGITSLREASDIQTSDNKWANYSGSLEFISPRCGPDYVVTLLWIETPSYVGHAWVEQAWLLGPGGGTVERLSGA